MIGVQWGQNILLKVLTKNLIYSEFDSVFEVLVKNSYSRPFQGAFFPDTLNTIKKELLKKNWFVRVIYDAAFIPQSVISRFIWLLKAFCRCPFFQNIYVCSLVCTRMYINVPPNMYLCTSTQALKCFQVRTQE